MPVPHSGKAVALPTAPVLLLRLQVGCTRQSRVQPLPSPGFFPDSLPLLIQQSPSFGSDCSSETPCCLCLKNRTSGGKKKKSRVFYRPLGRPRNIHMLSDSCLSPFPLTMVREGSAVYKRRDPHPPYYPPSHTFTPTPLQSPFPHSESVQQSPQQQQRRLITVKHLRLLFNSLLANATSAYKQKSRRKHKLESNEKITVLATLLAQKSKRRTPHGEILIAQYNKSQYWPWKWSKHPHRRYIIYYLSRASQPLFQIYCRINMHLFC